MGSNTQLIITKPLVRNSLFKLNQWLHTYIHYFLSHFPACGENKRKDKLKNDPENKPDTTMPHGPVCTSVIISDRFLITAAHCLEG